MLKGDCCLVLAGGTLSAFKLLCRTRQTSLQNFVDFFAESLKFLCCFCFTPYVVMLNKFKSCLLHYII